MTLRRLIREMLLVEAAYTPDRAAEEGFTFSAVKTNWGSGGWDLSAFGELREPVGIIKISLPLVTGKCHGAYEVNQSYVGDSGPDGIGPLLYDIAIELTGPAGLMSDRSIVSPSARKVWQYYHDRRPDVDHLQLDSLPGTITPYNEEDDCYQQSARDDARDWKKSSLSKVYRKKGTPVIDRLKALGIIEIVG